MRRGCRQQQAPMGLHELIVGMHELMRHARIRQMSKPIALSAGWLMQ